MLHPTARSPLALLLLLAACSAPVSSSTPREGDGLPVSATTTREEPPPIASVSVPAPTETAPNATSAPVEDRPAPARVVRGDADGLVIEDVRVGKGPIVSAGQKAVVHYVGTLSDGRKFDSSRDRGKPFEFSLGAGHVIQGWDRGVVGMRVGGIRRLEIPPALGYGERGHPPTIPPGATLIFEVELMAIL